MKLFFSLLILVLIAFFFEVFVCNFYEYRFFNLLENIILITLISSIVNLFERDSIKKILNYLSLFFIVIILFFENVYYFIFNSNLSASGVFVIFQTNTYESYEFFKTYLTIELVVLLFIYIFTVIYNKRILNLFVKKNSEISSKIINLTIIVFSILIISIPQLIVHNLPYLFYKTAKIYSNEIKSFEKYSNKLSNNIFKDLTFKVTNKEELHFIIIGESTNRKHFSLISNYHRNTTPKLLKLKDELCVYNNVISPETSTIASLKKVLTLSNNEDQVPHNNASVIQLLNKANYKTFWLTNQRSISKYDTHVTSLASACNVYKATNTETGFLKTPFDESLFQFCNDVFNDKAQKKVVFFHLMGTHAAYENRYPEEFNLFKRQSSEEKINTIDHYDNAVLYQDFLISELINKLKNKKIKSSLLYFSDHGEEVYDEIEFAGHAVDGIKTKNMFEIPFIYWSSDKGKVCYNENKAYMTDDLIHSMGDMLRFKSANIDSTRSIFNKSFQEKERFVKINNERQSAEKSFY